MVKNKHKGLTLSEFGRIWNDVNKSPDRIKGWSDHNIVLEVTGSQIMADDYRVDYYDDDSKNGLLIFYYRGFIVARIELKYIKDVY